MEENKKPHTPEPWAYNEHTYRVWAATNQIERYRENDAVVCEMSGYHVRHDEMEANAARIVACVNACKGVSNEWLQSNGVQALIDCTKEIERREANHTLALEIQRDELFEALKGVTSALIRVLDKHDPDSIEYEWIGNAHELITKFQS